MESLANRTIDTLKADERAGKNSVIMCAGKYYAAIDPDEGLLLCCFSWARAAGKIQKIDYSV